MSACPHCKGTGKAPGSGTAKLECVGCQRPVSVDYESSAELVRICVDVRCRDCAKAARDAAPSPRVGDALDTGFGDWSDMGPMQSAEDAARERREKPKAKFP